MVSRIFKASQIALEKEKKFRLALFFDLWWKTYIIKPAKYITSEQYKAVAAIQVCRTEALGVDHYVCHECGEITQVYHSCKNRFCPTCSWKDTLQWADKMKDQMYPPHHPHQGLPLGKHYICCKINSYVKSIK